ncbi:Aste57867_21639 [Aphanomyces stellatus]|uniref:Aste57867_21639 protein n=1 Tax=Aphanomyces stellatus TaxID=120398 RepID=A0A485LIR7_9STRA|nr:hypothetical protein As57867_021570 [Aphanomyces stellatus]VFT98308.1 Aste57867_21639 [Aphanomyces stellatus]
MSAMAGGAGYGGASLMTKEEKGQEKKGSSDFGELADVIVPPQVEAIDVAGEMIGHAALESADEIPNELPIGPTDDDDAMQDDDPGALPPSEAYLAHCYSLGILSHGQFNDLENFDMLKEKVRQLALRTGFRVRVQRPSSGHRRVWICKSKSRCPFSIVGNKNRRGVSIVTKLAHNHALHTTTTDNTLSLCEASTQEMATFVRNSDLYVNTPDLSKITAQQISNVVHAKTGYHINAMRASRIKHMLMDDPESFFVPESTSTTNDMAGAAAASWKTLAESVWDGFMLIVNDPHTMQTMGIPAIKKMVSTFKKVTHKDTLRGIVLMSCPNPESAPSSTSNRPSASKFLENYRRQEQFGFFD